LAASGYRAAARADTRIADKRKAMGDPEFRAIYLEYDAAFDWSPDDPRLNALAERAQRWIGKRRSSVERGAGVVQVPDIPRLVATTVTASSPAWARLTENARQRKPAVLLWRGRDITIASPARAASER